jgi:hypothetical protein
MQAFSSAASASLPLPRYPKVQDAASCMEYALVQALSTHKRYVCRSFEAAAERPRERSTKGYSPAAGNLPCRQLSPATEQARNGNESKL